VWGSVVKRQVEFGFSLIELLMVVALVGIVSVIGMPLLGQIAGSIELGEAARQVERELQSARMAAVAANQPVRVMFNCPVAEPGMTLLAWVGVSTAVNSRFDGGNCSVPSSR